MNVCKKCGVPIGDHSKTMECRKCHRTPQESKHRRPYYRRKMYGMEDADFRGLMMLQAGRCPICLVELDDSIQEGKRTNIHVDHDHVTGKVNGLLCKHCNPGIGYLMNDPDRLARAIVYCLRAKHPKRQVDCDTLAKRLFDMLNDWTNAQK